MTKEKRLEYLKNYFYKKQRKAFLEMIKYKDVEFYSEKINKINSSYEQNNYAPREFSETNSMHHLQNARCLTKFYKETSSVRTSTI